MGIYVCQVCVYLLISTLEIGALSGPPAKAGRDFGREDRRPREHSGSSRSPAGVAQDPEKGRGRGRGSKRNGVAARGPKFLPAPVLGVSAEQHARERRFASLNRFSDCPGSSGLEVGWGEGGWRGGVGEPLPALRSLPSPLGCAMISQCCQIAYQPRVEELRLPGAAFHLMSRAEPGTREEPEVAGRQWRWRNKWGGGRDAGDARDPRVGQSSSEVLCRM